MLGCVDVELVYTLRLQDQQVGVTAGLPSE